LETLSLAAAMADQQHRAAITEKQELLQGQENDRAWLEEHKAVERLAIRLDDITAQLSTITKVSNEITALVEKAIAARTRLDSALGEQRAAELQLAALDRRIVEIDAALQKLSGEIANENRDALEGQKDAIHSAAVTATAASSAAKAWAEASGSTKAEQEEEDNQNHAAEQASSTVADSSRLLLIEASALEEARRSLELSDATASEQAERLRSKLADGKPCPVCGSLEHPLHEIGETLRRRVEADKRRVAELETSVQRLTREGATATAQQEAAVKAANAANVRKLRAQEILEANAAEWARTITDLRRVVPSAGLSFPFEITLEADPTAVLIVLQKGIAGAESLLNSRLQKLTNAEKQAGKLVSERDQARSNRDKQNKVIGELTTRRTRLEYEITLTEANAAGLQRQKDTAVSLANGILQHIVTDWTSRLDAGPDDFVRFCSESAAEWMRRSERADAVKTELQGLQSQIATLQATAKERSDAVAAAENRHNDTCSSVEACKAERSKVIGGRPHGEVRTEYRLAREAAEVNLRNSAEQLNGCEHALLAAGTELSSAEQQVEAARLAHANAVTNRDKRLVELGVSPDEANDSLRVGEAWIQAEEIRLRQLEDARNSSRTILQEREGALKTHESTGKPSPDPQELTTKLTETQAHIDGLSATLVQARAVQENDRKARERVAELSQLIETRSAGAMLWATLNDLIGSADGARFRRFAQSLTFEQLVLFANQRLSELKPRYELQRAPGSDHLGLQVIDHDMADEVRGVHSLSGGERFLVSLALALGLASMSSNQGVKVESLFIDEGFGALDSASLGIALSVLERLQASGRRIGVISHVDELKERIAVRVDVSPDGNGRSSVRVLAG
jgi:exonuclease SbcC